MKKRMINMDAIRALRPCYDPKKYLPEDFNQTIQEFLCIESMPPQDRIWVIVRTAFLTKRELKEFGVACARLVEYLSADTRVVNCNQVTEAFLDNRATMQQLRAARADAADAAYAAAHAVDANYAADYANYAAAYADAAYAADASQTIREEQCQLLLHVLEMSQALQENEK